MIRLLALCLALSVAAVVQVSGQSASVMSLESGKAITSDLRGGQTHTYRITVLEGQYTRVRVEQQGIDVIVRLREDGQKEGVDFDRALSLHDEEIAEFVAAAPGDYTISLESKYKSFQAGQYRIEIAEKREANERDRRLEAARKSEAQSLRLRAKGEYAAASKLAEQVVAIRTAELGSRHIDTALALYNAAKLREDQGNYDEAELLAEKALSIRETELKPGHPDIAISLLSLANILRAKEDLDHSIELCERACAIVETSLGSDHPVLGVILITLGTVYRNKGDLLKATQVYRRALSVEETALGSFHHNVAVVANNLGLVYTDKGEYASAARALRQAITIWEKNNGENHPNLFLPVMNLANVLAMSAEYEEAEALYKRALDLGEKAFGTSHPNIGRLLYNFASCLRYKGEIARSEAMYGRALTIVETAFGTGHPLVARVLDSQAILSELKGNMADALLAQQRSAKITERALGLNLAVGSERQRLAYISRIPEQTGQIIATALRAGGTHYGSAELAATVLLQRKGRVQDAIGDTMAALRRRANPDDLKLLDELNGTTAELAKLVLGETPVNDRITVQERAQILEDRRQGLEDWLSRDSAAFRLDSRPVTLQAIQTVIPRDAALVEYVVYQPVNLTASTYDQRLDPARYAVVVVRTDGPPKWWDLGDAKEMELAISQFRQALRNPRRHDTREVARALYSKMMMPIRGSLTHVSQLLISPDGALNLIPYAALVNQEGEYLVQRYSLAYLTTGRDLLRMRANDSNLGQDRPLILANPAFGDTETRRVEEFGAGSKRRSKRRSVTTGAELSNLYFAPLPKTQEEARVIQRLFPESLVLEGAKATEAAIKQAAAPQMIHVATHGFFLDDHSINSFKPASEGLAASAELPNPMLRAGLALAGANTRSGMGQDGILTALETSGLNLWGTKLVTLSACDTGLGEVRNGEGVYGFRRALFLAGAETIVMSLWPVSDGVTSELMGSYYSGLRAGEGRGEALRQVQLKMLKRVGRQHPFYWAGFIQSGEWGNLEGRR